MTDEDILILLDLAKDPDFNLHELLVWEEYHDELLLR